MRQIGTIQGESNARLFGEFLYAKGIASQVEHDAGENWHLWIHDEDSMETARNYLQAFQKNPADSVFREESKKANKLREEQVASNKAYARRFKTSEEVLPQAFTYTLGLMTMILIGICVWVAFKTKLGKEDDLVRSLSIATSVFADSQHGRFYQVMHGEIWRLLTPAFMHFNPTHLICNMLWLFQLGSLIESRSSSKYGSVLGSLFVLCQVVFIGVVSNIAQYLIHGPRFGGMSGVVFGLFGYVWIRGHFDRSSGMAMDNSTVFLMMAWFFICFTGWVGPIANTAHASGLIVGMIWGFIAAKWR